MRPLTVVLSRLPFPRVSLDCFAMVAAASGLLLLALAGDPVAAAGPDDNCSGATILEFLQDGQIVGDLSSYANDYDPGEPGPSCTGQAAPGRDLVLAVDIPCGGGIYLDYQPNGYDGAIYIVRDCLDVSGSCVIGADAGGVGVSESTGMNVVMGGTFYIIVDAHDPGAGGPFSVNYGFFVWDIPPGACCFPDGHCEFLGDGVCISVGGVDLGPCSQCEPDPCTPTPSEGTTWGRIKATYR